MDWKKIKLGLWGATGGAIILAIIGFNWGGWVTGRTAREMAEVAVVDRLAPICVEQFKRDPQRNQKFQELKNGTSWQRDEYIEKQGWAIMPGQTKHESNVSEKCSNLILQLGQ